MSPSNWLVLGLGNRLSGADAFGPSVIDALATEGDVPPDVTLLDVHTDLIGNLDRFAAYDHVILVDTILNETTAGVAVVDEPIFSSWDTRSAGTHEMSAVMAVRLFRTLQMKDAPPHPRITLVAYRVSETDFQQAPDSSIIMDGMRAVRRLIRAEHHLHS